MKLKILKFLRIQPSLKRTVRTSPRRPSLHVEKMAIFQFFMTYEL